MKVLLTGANGFLGQYVKKRLLNDGVEVFTTDLAGSSDFEGDLSNVEFVKTLPDVDTVIHCAAVQYVTKHKPLFNWKKYFTKHNIQATQNIINRYKNSSTHFVHVGTSMQYEQNGAEQYSENSPMGSQGVYSWSKLQAQDIVNSSGLNTATIVPCIIGGPGREGLFAGFVNTIGRYSVAIIPGKGVHKISIVHVDDVAKLLCHVAHHRLTGSYNAAADNPLSITEWAQIIGTTLKKPKVKIIRLPLLPFKVLGVLSGYRLLASEQLLMLSMPHVLSTEKSRSLGLSTNQSSEKIITDITMHLTAKK